MFVSETNMMSDGIVSKTMLYLKKKKDILYEKEMGDFAEIIREPLSVL